MLTPLRQSFSAHRCASRLRDPQRQTLWALVILGLSSCLTTGLQSAPSCWTTLCQDRVAHILLAVGPDLYLLDHAACSTVVRACEMGVKWKGWGRPGGGAEKLVSLDVLPGPASDTPWPGPRSEQLPADGCFFHLPTPGTLHRHGLYLDGDSFTQGLILGKHRGTLPCPGIRVEKGLFNLSAWTGP